MKSYVTTAIPYVNGAPHIGHAMDYCLADVFARYRKMSGDTVRFQAGTDEHGNKIFQKAKELNVPVEEYVAVNAKKFQDFIALLGVEYTDFVRTTDPDHERRCQEIWKKLSDHIYMAKYEGFYCTGCERFVTDKEVEENNGICPDHQKSYEKLAEENYYFRIADFKDQIREAILSGEMLILPDDPGQVMYVWIDALANYITVLGYPEKEIKDFWPASAQFVGKDILRFHAIIWPAMLMGLGLELPKVLVSHGMVLADGQKMSKSIGNVVDPIEVLSRRGLDAFRYFFLRHIDTFADSDYTDEKFERAYNNELANDLGNLVQRLATLAHKNNITIGSSDEFKMPKEYIELMDRFEFSKAFDYVWEKIQAINRRIDEEKPWSLAKNGETEKLEECLRSLINELLSANYLLSPFLPLASEKISEIFKDPIRPPETPLFPKQ